MSSRAVRKALKRLEAQKELEKESSIATSPDDDEAEVRVDDNDNTGLPSNPFAMVCDPTI